MTLDDLRRLGDVHTGLPSTFCCVRFEYDDNRDKPPSKGDHVEGHLDAADMPGDVTTLLDAYPELLARVKGLEAEVKRLRAPAYGAECSGEPHRSCGPDPCVCR